LTSFFPIVDIMFCCKDVVRQRSKLVPTKQFFAPPQPVVVNAWGSLDQLFQIAVISEYVSNFGWDQFSDLRDQASKKRKKKKKNK